MGVTLAAAEDSDRRPSRPPYFKMKSMLDNAPMERVAGTIDVQMVHCQRSHSSLTLAYT